MAGARSFLLLAAAGALVAGCQTIRPPTPERLAECDRLIARYAKTRPGVLTVQEWGQHAWDTSGPALDKNHDGRIDLQEWTGAIALEPEPYRKSAIDHARLGFEKLDRGHKGYLDPADIARDAAGSFRIQDLNHDGWLTRSECATMHIYPELV